MRLRKIFKTGKILDHEMYQRLQDLDAEVFFGCFNEFKENRDWWVSVDKGRIVAYCGCLYSEGVCIFVRAWVHKSYRGHGLHRKMIEARLRSAKESCRVAITYTTTDNYPSANNLIKHGFRLYGPAFAYAGKDVLYFKKTL